MRLWIGFGAIGFVLFMGLGSLRLLPVPAAIEITWPSRQSSVQYIPTYTHDSDNELVMVYMGSSTCGFANNEALPAVIERAKISLYQNAQAHGYAFSAIGVAVDRHVSNGVKYLEKFGLFDEIMTGDKWHGVGVQKYYRGAFASELSTPQVLVYSRRMQVPGPERLDQSYHVSDDRLLVRKIGVDEIGAWAQRGMPLPTNMLTPGGL